MKKLIYLNLLLLFSCSTYKVNETYVNNCQNYQFVESVSLKQLEVDNGKTVYSSQKSFIYANLLEKAKIKHGENVTVDNVKWDVCSQTFLGIKWDTTIGVTYDIIKCK